jgi:hypothetical protein
VRGSAQRRNQRIVSNRKARVRANLWRYDSVTPDDRRAHVPGSTYFSTANTDRRRTFLTDADVRSALREAIGTLRLTHPFLIEALLPAPANDSARTRALRPLSPCKMRRAFPSAITSKLTGALLFGAGSSPDFVDTVVPQTAIVSYWTGDRYPNDE